MSHELTIRDGNALDVSALQSNIDPLAFERILPDRTNELEVRTGLDGDDDTYGRYHYPDTAPKDDIVSDLKALLPDTSTVDYRHTWAEYDDTKTNDLSYYPSHWTEGLRAPPAVTQDGKTIDVSVDYLYNGTELSDSLKQSFALPTEKYGQVHTIYADSDGLKVASTKEIDNPKHSSDTWDKPDFTGVEICTVYMKGHIDRIPNGGYKVATFPP